MPVHPLPNGEPSWAWVWLTESAGQNLKMQDLGVVIAGGEEHSPGILIRPVTPVTRNLVFWHDAVAFPFLWEDQGVTSVTRSATIGVPEVVSWLEASGLIVWPDESG